MLKLVPVYVEFKNTKQKSALSPGFWVGINSTEEFIEEIWNIAKVTVKREIICDPVDKTQCFTEKAEPDVSDAGSFLKIVDIISHVTLEIQAMSDDRLQFWSDGRKLDLHIYPYGITVITKAQWTAIHKGTNALIKEVEVDKTGAPKEEELVTLAKTLQEVHKYHYVAPFVTWKAWAEHILKKKVEDRDRLIHNAPPLRMIDLFKVAATNSDREYEFLQHDLALSGTVAEGVALDIDGLIQSFERVVEARRALQVAEKLHEEKLRALKAKISVTGETLRQVHVRTRAQANMQGAEYEDDIQYASDDQHEEYLDEEVLFFVFYCTPKLLKSLVNG